MIKGVVFDLDGTITRPFLDFKQIRLDIGVEVGRVSLLDQIEDLDEEKRRVAFEVLERHESEAALNAELNDGVWSLLETIHKWRLPVGIITRNSEKSTSLVVKNLGITADPVITRDSGLAIKPDPEPLLHIAEKWDVDPTQIIMIGDYVFDVECGKAAGSKTCLVTNGREVSDTGDPDYIVSGAVEIVPILSELIKPGY